jgi:CHAT domain-containing protein
MPDPSLCVDWFSGPSAQLEIFSPEPAGPPGLPAAAADYRLRYVPPFRATIRPPVASLQLGPGELTDILQRLDDLAGLATDAVTRGSNDAATLQLETDRDQRLELTGKMLFIYVIPPYVEADFRPAERCLELGIDEDLVQFPWELMHDGEQYLSLKHNLGRFVNSRASTAMATIPPVIGQSLDKLGVLVICVARPTARAGRPPIAALPGAEAEMQAILDTLSGLNDVKVEVLSGKTANYDSVFQALTSGRYHIIHYIGHATFDTQMPYKSALVLYDRDLTTGPLAKMLAKKPPVLCFLNACESGQSRTWGANYNLYDLARSLLSTGAYLIGSRWKLEDQPAVTMAMEFYTALIKNYEPIGCALRRARIATRAAHARSFAWASYVFYGDPRLYFRHSTGGK